MKFEQAPENQSESAGQERLVENTDNAGGVNIYEKTKFLPEQAREHLESLKEDFKEFYSSHGYKEHPSVKITSGVDPTVRFIGSHISVYKPYLVEDSVPNPGYFMSQDCVRTRNADRLLDDDYFPNWGSYFPSLGTIAHPERLDEVCEEVFDFFEQKLKIAKENIRIRINSNDADLVESCLKHYGEENLERDTKPAKYYQHKLGLEGIGGRNFNVALRDSGTDTFSDVGNVIILENSEKKLGIEFALGSTTTLKQLYGLDHILDCTPVTGLKCENEALRRKFEDAVITSTVLFREGLRPLGQHNRNRILKQYVRSLSYFRSKTGMSIEELSGIISNFESRELSSSKEDACSKTIGEYVQAYENELRRKKDRNQEEEKILQALNQPAELK